MSSRYKESTTFEDFISRVYNPNPTMSNVGGSSIGISAAPLAAALIDSHRSSVKGLLMILYDVKNKKIKI